MCYQGPPAAAVSWAVSDASRYSSFTFGLEPEKIQEDAMRRSKHLTTEQTVRGKGWRTGSDRTVGQVVLRNYERFLYWAFRTLGRRFSVHFEGRRSFSKFAVFECGVIQNTVAVGRDKPSNHMFFPIGSIELCEMRVVGSHRVGNTCREGPELAAQTNHQVGPSGLEKSPRLCSQQLNSLFTSTLIVVSLSPVTPLLPRSLAMCRDWCRLYRHTSPFPQRGEVAQLEKTYDSSSAKRNFLLGGITNNPPRGRNT